MYKWRQKKSHSFVFGQLRPVEARNWQRVEINREAVEMPLHFSKLPEIFPNCLRCQKCSLTFLKKNGRFINFLDLLSVSQSFSHTFRFLLCWCLWNPPDQDRPGQTRTDQDRPGQTRTDQDRPGQTREDFNLADLILELAF